VLRDDAFQPQLAGVLEHDGSDLALCVLIELDTVARFGQQLFEPVFSGVKRLRADTVAANGQQNRRLSAGPQRYASGQERTLVVQFGMSEKCQQQTF
jgi:hypothetical protein